jgi:hypothetical protein
MEEVLACVGEGVGDKYKGPVVLVSPFLPLPKQSR